MILSPQGEVAAILAGRDAAGAFAVPFDAFSGTINSVLRDGKAVRPLLGLRYVDLSRLVGVDARGGRGALVSASADGVRPAVLRGSPAGLAGIVAGDVILAVNGEEITAKTALADVVAEYAPGTRITLTVAGPEGERRVELTLGSSAP
jgi:serine protease Do